MKRRFRLPCLFFLTVFLTLAGLPVLFAQQFNWKMEVAKLVPGGQAESLPFGRVIRAGNDDTVELRLATNSSCYCYAIIRGSGGEIAVLNNSPLAAGAGRSWRVKLESPPGSETIYVVMAASRQDNLEKVIREYRENSNVKNADAVYHEVLKIQAEGMSGKERPPEASLSGATVRGEFEVEYYDSDRYVKTVTIRH
ncbi:MAG: DUF4384 domain-containing protein [Treponema sp.]|jgi:hypothetical protein|nr:DUF4384 domain-containing protein [Treponema sp.]